MKDILAHIKRVESETQMQSLLQTALATHQAQMSGKVSALVQSPSFVNRYQPAAEDGGGRGGCDGVGSVDRHRQSPVVMTSDLPPYLAEIRSLSRARARALTLSLYHSLTYSLWYMTCSTCHGTCNMHVRNSRAQCTCAMHVRNARAQWEYARHGVKR